MIIMYLTGIGGICEVQLSSVVSRLENQCIVKKKLDRDVSYLCKITMVTSQLLELALLNF